MNVAWSLGSGTEEKAGKGRHLQKLAKELEESFHLQYGNRTVDFFIFSNNKQI